MISGLSSSSLSLKPLFSKNQLEAPEHVGGEGVAGELVEAVKIERGVFDHLRLVELVEVGEG